MDSYNWQLYSGIASKGNLRRYRATIRIRHSTIAYVLLVRVESDIAIPFNSSCPESHVLRFFHFDK